MEQRITIKEECINKPYADTLYIHYVRSETKLAHQTEFHPETGSLLEQTALKVAACIPFGKDKMYKWKDDPEREWHETYISLYEEIEPGYARVIIKRPNLD